MSPTISYEYYNNRVGNLFFISMNICNTKQTFLNATTLPFNELYAHTPTSRYKRNFIAYKSTSAKTVRTDYKKTFFAIFLIRYVKAAILLTKRNVYPNISNYVYVYNFHVTLQSIYNSKMM
jgi:hypothetical protein